MARDATINTSLHMQVPFCAFNVRHEVGWGEAYSGVRTGHLILYFNSNILFREIVCLSFSWLLMKFLDAVFESSPCNGLLKRRICITSSCPKNDRYVTTKQTCAYFWVPSRWTNRRLLTGVVFLIFSAIAPTDCYFTTSYRFAAKRWFVGIICSATNRKVAHESAAMPTSTGKSR